MPGELADKIKKEIVMPNTNQPLLTAGYVEFYDKKTNRIVVRAENPYTQEITVFENVDMPSSLNGVSSSGPFRGDQVLLGFINNNYSRPYIICFIENNFYQNTRENKQKHETQGSYLPNTDDKMYDDYDGRMYEDKPPLEEAGGIFNFLVKIFNKVIGKRQPIQDPVDIDKESDFIPFFDTAEVGLIHPKNNSVVKIKDDGSIDLFSYMNEGIRINPVNSFITTISGKIRSLAGNIFYVMSKGCIKIIGEDFINIRSKNENFTAMSDNKSILLRSYRGDLEIEARRILWNGSDLVWLIKQEIMKALAGTDNRLYLNVTGFARQTVPISIPTGDGGSYDTQINIDAPISAEVSGYVSHNSGGWDTETSQYDTFMSIYEIKNVESIHEEMVESGQVIEIKNDLPQLNKPSSPKYNKKHNNGKFGSFYYRDLLNTKGQIEVDPAWVEINIVRIEVPKQLQKFTNTLRVNKLIANQWKSVLNRIANDTELLALVKQMDAGTFYPRHINHNFAKGISNHSWGTAIDINPSFDGAQGRTAKPGEPVYILYQKVFSQFGFNWGNSYQDPMHFEFLG